MVCNDVLPFNMSSEHNLKYLEKQPDSTEACLGDNLELLDLGRVPSITTGPWIHINTRNRDQTLMDLFNLQKYYVMSPWLSCNAHIETYRGQSSREK